MTATLGSLGVTTWMPRTRGARWSMPHNLHYHGVDAAHARSAVEAGANGYIHKGDTPGWRALDFVRPSVRAGLMTDQRDRHL